MRHAVPEEHFLLLLRSYAIILVHEVEERTLGLLKRGIGARLEIAQIRKDALFELLRVLDGSPESLKSEREAADDVCTRDVKEIVPASGQIGSKAIVLGASLIGPAHHSTHETYSPVGSRNLRMYWSGVQSTGAEMRKYLTTHEISFVSPQSGDCTMSRNCGNGIEELGKEHR